MQIRRDLMKRLLLSLGVICALCSGASATEWLTDLPTALARAKKENKAVLLDFTGSDWCGWCKKLKSEVFDTFEFGAYSAANLILVEVDFPRRKKINLDQLNANYALAAQYGIKGYPTIVVINADGRLLGECGYIPGGPVAFVDQIEKFPGMPHKGKYLVSGPGDSSVNPAPNPPADSLRRPTPGVAPQPAVTSPPPYGELTLKGVSGIGKRRIALINNETFMTGESAFVKSFGTNIEVTVQEIRDSSVLVVVKGQTRELSLARAPAKP
jgi:thioredoxin-related protein